MEVNGIDMELIDREKLKAAIRKKFKTLQERFEINNIINEQPTVAVAPAVSAYPIFDHVSVMARCSNCKRYTIGYDMDGWDNYCSCCGAKMDGKRKEGE